MNQSKIKTKSEQDIVEINKEDITSDSSDDESKYFSDLGFNRSSLTKTSCTQPLKVESEFTRFNEEIGIKIKTEDDSSDDFSDYFIETAYLPHTSHIVQLKDTTEFRKCGEETDIDIKVEEESSDEFIEHFTETSIKTEKLAEYYDSETNRNVVNTIFFNRDYKEAYIKEDIEIEEHEIKLETIDCRTEHAYKEIKDNNSKVTKAGFKCKFCTYETSSSSSFKKHSSLHEDPSKVTLYFCTKCNYRTRQKCHLRRHDLVHKDRTQIKMFECAICTFRTKQKCTLKRHIESVHIHLQRKEAKSKDTVENDQLLSCSQCSYTTYRRGLLMSHLDKHKDTRDMSNLYICDICSFSTKYRRNLRVHFETHKESEELQIYECKLCKFKTRMGYCLKRHLLSRKHLLAAGKIEEYCPRTLKSQK